MERRDVWERAGLVPVPVPVPVVHILIADSNHESSGVSSSLSLLLLLLVQYRKIGTVMTLPKMKLAIAAIIYYLSMCDDECNVLGILVEGDEFRKETGFRGTPRQQEE